MRNKLDVICIDGVIGVGKTTQVVIFRNLLKEHKIPHKIFHLKEIDDTKYTYKQLTKIEQYLKENPDGLAICDGSIAIDIVDDMAKNMHKEKLWEKHKDNLQLYESLNNKFNFINILLSPVDLGICSNRLAKKEKMSGIKEQLPNNEHLRVISQGLRNFDNNMITYNIKFNNIDLLGNENITDIHKKILEIIGSKFQIKKPSFEG